MSQNNEKIVQALIQAIVNISKKIIEADDLAQMYKTKFVNLKPDLSGTNISATQLNAINIWFDTLNSLRNDNIITIAMNKNQSSHGTKALD